MILPTLAREAICRILQFCYETLTDEGISSLMIIGIIG